jgi:hypothetical protein
MPWIASSFAATAVRSGPRTAGTSCSKPASSSLGRTISWFRGASCSARPNCAVTGPFASARLGTGWPCSPGHGPYTWPSTRMAGSRTFPVASPTRPTRRPVACCRLRTRRSWPRRCPGFPALMREARQSRWISMASSSCGPSQPTATGRPRSSSTARRYPASLSDSTQAVRI